MTAFAFVPLPDDQARLVIRRHDLSGCDYEGVCTLPRQVADAIDERGFAIPASDTMRFVGRPGVVLLAEPEGRIQVRADVGDPTTVVAECDLDPFTAAICVSGAPVPIRWVTGPKTV